MEYQSIFERYELKFLITTEQKKRILKTISSNMVLDQYGRSTIRNVYYDTEDYRLIRNSIEKPIYKEKLRIRSYQRVTTDGDVFVELKKKYNKVVYKRRISLPLSEAVDWCDGKRLARENQIIREINYFMHYYQPLKPKMFISYQREAYREIGESNLRITFDEQILCRKDNLSFSADIYGISLLNNDMVLMEVKCSAGLPIWLTSILSDNGLYKTSFSKYGTAYMKEIFPKLYKKLNYEGEI